MVGGAAVFLGTGVFTMAVVASPAGSGAQLMLQPNHLISGNPPEAGHGHGGGGGGGGGGSYGWRSSNWSGYAVAAGGYSSVSGSWIVPNVRQPRRSSYGFSATWVGIGGFVPGDLSLIQTGTEQDYFGGASYNAWWTTSELQYGEQAITTGCTPSVANCGSVQPGDLMTATISQGSPDWSIVLSDTTEKWTYQTSTPHTSSNASAEWIVEAPSSTFGVLPLADYGSSTFDHGTVNGSSPSLAVGNGGYMVQNGSTVSIPSSPDSPETDAVGSDGFGMAYGSTPPPAPAS